jgi:predicted dehydrogenase
MLNIGIIGPGRVAARHAKALQEIDGMQLWSVAGRDLERTRQFAAEYGAKNSDPAFDKIANMLEDPELNVVIIATPDKLHKEHILMALQAKKSILVEKPLCTSLTDCNELLTAAHTYQQALSVAYHLRWDRGFRMVAQKCHNNEFGNIRHLRLHWAVDYNKINALKWRLDRNYSKWFAVTVLGTHLIDLARWILLPVCGEVVDVKATLNKDTSMGGFEQEACIILQFTSGMTAEIFCSLTFNSALKMELYGSKAQVNVCGSELIGTSRQLSINNQQLDIEQQPSQYILQLEHFAKVIKFGHAPAVSFYEGAKNVECMLAISDLG